VGPVLVMDPVVEEIGGTDAILRYAQVVLTADIVRAGIVEASIKAPGLIRVAHEDNGGWFINGGQGLCREPVACSQRFGPRAYDQGVVRDTDFRGALTVGRAAPDTTGLVPRFGGAMLTVLDIGLQQVGPHAGRVSPGDKEGLIVVLNIHRVSQADLLDVGQAGSFARLLTCLSKNGEENRGENRDNGDDNEQFDQGEPTLAGSSVAPMHLLFLLFEICAPFIAARSYRTCKHKHS